MNLKTVNNDPLNIFTRPRALVPLSIEKKMTEQPHHQALLQVWKQRQNYTQLEPFKQTYR